MPFLPPNQQRQSTEGKRLFTLLQKKTNSNCCTADVYLLLFNASYYLYSPSTASGARYRKSACIDTCWGLHQWLVATWAEPSTQSGVCTMWLISVEQDWKHVLMQKVATLNTCLPDIQLPHTTTGSFQSHWWQPTTGSLQSLRCLKECNKPSVWWKSFAFHKLTICFLRVDTWQSCRFWNSHACTL